MVRLFLTFVSFSLLLTISCSKEHLQRANCSNLMDAILAGNPDEVENEINKACSTLPDYGDSKTGITHLTAAISAQCGISATVLCHNCISTSPAQSEIKISVSTGNLQKDKVIDISCNDNNKLVFAGMHD